MIAVDLVDDILIPRLGILEARRIDRTPIGFLTLHGSGLTRVGPEDAGGLCSANAVQVITFALGGIVHDETAIVLGLVSYEFGESKERSISCTC